MTLIYEARIALACDSSMCGVMTHESTHKFEFEKQKATPITHVTHVSLETKVALTSPWTEEEVTKTSPHRCFALPPPNHKDFGF